MRRGLLALALLGMLAGLGGCFFGPRALPANHQDYNVSLQETHRRQLLLNLVRKKYREPPFFLQVGAVSSSLNYGANAGGSATVPEAALRTYGLNLGGNYSESPTITYTPLQGEQFASRVLAELDMNRFALLYRAGWSVDLMLRTLVARLGPLQNDPFGGADETYRRFLELAELWRGLQRRGDLVFSVLPGDEQILNPDVDPAALTPDELIRADQAGYRFVRVEGGRVELRKPGSRFLAVEARYRDAAEADRAAALLGVDPARQAHPNGGLLTRVRIVPYSRLAADGAAPGEIPAVPLQLRSFNDVLFYLAQAVEVPADHRRRGVVKSYRTPGGDRVPLAERLADLLHVQHSPGRPEAAYAMVAYRGGWFYIADADLRSKDTFALLGTIFALQSGDVESVQPVLTLSVGN